MINLPEQENYLQTSKNVSILHLSLVPGSGRRCKLEQGGSDFSSLSHFFWEDSKAQTSQETSQHVLDLPRGFLSDGHAWKTSLVKRSRVILTRCLYHLNWLSSLCGGAAAQCLKMSLQNTIFTCAVFECQYRVLKKDYTWENIQFITLDHRNICTCTQNCRPTLVSKVLLTYKLTEQHQQKTILDKTILL